MPTLPDFRLETYFAKWEFNARYNLTASDAESISLRELLAMATPEDREDYESMWLGYTETYGAPELRETVSELFQHRSPEDVLCFAGASEGIYAAYSVLLDKNSHAVVVTPNYQSHETLAVTTCATTGVPLDPTDNWSLDIDRVAEAVKPNTKLITINFPHNPTGAILSHDRLIALVKLCRRQGIYILSDEIFNGLGRTETEHLPFVADVYERGLSLNVMSKSYGLPGLRIGWIASEDREILSKMERMKHYLSICNSGPSEKLANIALGNRDRLLTRNCSIVDENLARLDAFFARYQTIFDWQASDGACIAYPRYKGPGGVEEFTRRLVEECSVLLLPSSIFASGLSETPTDRFRIAFGRRNMNECLAVLESHLVGNYS